MRTREWITWTGRATAAAARETGDFARHADRGYTTMAATVIAKSRKAAASEGTDATAATTKRTTRAVAASTGYTLTDVAKHDKVRRTHALRRMGGGSPRGRSARTKADPARWFAGKADRGKDARKKQAPSHILYFCIF